jgi:hypothetical protein
MWRSETNPMSSVLRDLGGCYVIVPPYQDSTGRNAGAGGPESAGFPPTYDFVDGAGLSGRAWVLDEPARLQPSVARAVTNRMSVHERMAMLNLFTSSPEAESPETLPLRRQRPVSGSGDHTTQKSINVRIVRESPWDCLA